MDKEIAKDIFTEIIAAEVQRSVLPEAYIVADALVALHGTNVAAIIFYGSCLRSFDRDGLFDFYLLIDDGKRFFDKTWLRVGNHLLPPNVYFRRFPSGEKELKAKIAVMTVKDFAKATSPAALDSSIWARFAQPSALVFARDDRVRAQVVLSLTDAVVTALQFCAPLVPANNNDALGLWRGIFSETYGAELRAERSNRPEMIVDPDAARYEKITPPALTLAGIKFWQNGDGLICDISSSRRRAARRRWQYERVKGKIRNLLRLMKAVFTFNGAVDYAIWKIERHANHKLELTDWQKRHPLLAAPRVLWRLYRQGILR